MVGRGKSEVLMCGNEHWVSNCAIACDKSREGKAGAWCGRGETGKETLSPNVPLGV